MSALENTLQKYLKKVFFQHVKQIKFCPRISLCTTLFNSYLYVPNFVSLLILNLQHIKGHI